MERHINKAVKEAQKNKKSVPVPLSLKKLSYDKNSQYVKLIKDMPVIARVTKKDHEIANNETFTIKSIKNGVITLENIEGLKVVNSDEFQKLFYVAFAITCHKSQGLTFNHPYTIHEFDNKKFDDRLKYVALSRTTKKEYINIIV